MLTFYHLPDRWSIAYAESQKATQKDVLNIPLYYVRDPKTGFYYYAAVRMGVSVDPKDVAQCYRQQGNSYGPIKSVTFKGKRYRVLNVSSAGMMQFMNGQSFRHRQEGACWAVEWVETGLNTDEAKFLGSVFKPVMKEMIAKMLG